MTGYNHEAVEEKWQNIWEKDKTFSVKNNSDKLKFYSLIEFPYPSGQGLHVGHLRSYVAMDIVSRKRRLQGYNVLYPIGWDAFGLPTENYAIKNKIHPKIVTKNNVDRFRKQLKSLGISFDWEREINTTDEQYYKWTQWIFLQLFKNKLAYKKETTVNWCTSCQCVLANEEVINGKCERCSNDVIHKKKSQWILKITKYAERLIEDLKLVDYPDKVKSQQKNWIGRSIGAEVCFETNIGEKLTVFTTRPETIFGVTYLVLSPEHNLIDEFKDKITNFEQLSEYIKLASMKSDLERTDLIKEKTGVKIDGIYAIHPITKQKLPIYISDYVLMSYGTGTVMAVPAHDVRDNEFAKKFGLPIIDVIDGEKIIDNKTSFNEKNLMINSQFLDGMTVKQARENIIKWLKDNGKGMKKINYKLRDWIFSRQRYWGEPIPIVICDKCGYVPINEENLPLTLPSIEFYDFNNSGESPLSKMGDWVNTVCPKCGGKAKRETDTMPQWAGSSWYYLRYMDPNNNDNLVGKSALKYWGNVDWYNGGQEHTTLHLLYSRFWHKFLYDIGVVESPEPYAKRTTQGMILGENGEKMSKSRGNIVNPDEIIYKYGADTLRIYTMFIGDFEKVVPWSTSSIKGCRRFLERFWNLQNILIDSADIREILEVSINKTIKKVSEDIENMKFNTAIANLMSILNEIYDVGTITKAELKVLCILLNPFAPHISEEIWQQCNFEKKPISDVKWVIYDINKCKDKEVEIGVQINGKTRTRVKILFDSTQDDVMKILNKNSVVLKYISGAKINKIIYVPNRLINLVINK